MNEVFDEDEFEPGQRRRDTELTLGPWLLLVLFFALLLLCGLCFGLGYALGSRSAQPASPPPAASSPAALTADSRAKPSAGPQGASPQPNPTANQPAPAASPATPATVQPAAPTQPAGTLMVQVAAVSHREDADVLVGALRKRGYEAAVNQDAADSQFHVRVGPFTNRNEADATRQKLLSDGYNAIVQP